MSPDTRMNESTRPSAAGEDAEEARLLKRVAGRDRDALTALYRIYHERLFRFLFRLTRSYSVSDELVNDIMFVVWESAASFRGDSKASTWIFGIAYRKAMRHLSRRKLKLADGKPLDEPAADETADAEREDWVRHGLEHLPASQQLTVMLVFYLGLSYPEVAEVTECPVNTVKSRMYHARRKLRELLEGSAVGGARAREDEED